MLFRRDVKDGELITFGHAWQKGGIIFAITASLVGIAIVLGGVFAFAVYR